MGDASYTVDLTSNYQFNTPCAKRSIDGQSAKYEDKCKDESSDEDVSRFHDGFLGVDILEVAQEYPVPEGYECRTFTLRFDDVVDSDPPIAPTQLPNQFVAWAELRERDEDGYLAGATTPVTLVSRKLAIADTPPRYDQCLRPIDDDQTKAWRVYPNTVWVERDHGGFVAQFSDNPSCASLELDEWPDPVDEEVFLDLTGYDVTVPASTSLETGPQGLTIVTDCDFTIENGASLAIDPDDDTISDITIVARNVSVAGSISNDSEVSATVHLAALESIAVESTGAISVSNLDREGQAGAGRIKLRSEGGIVIDGTLEANETNHGGFIEILGEDVTFNEGAVLEADADSQESGSEGGVIAIRARDDLDVYKNHPVYATFTALGETDGAIDIMACDADHRDGEFDTTPTVDNGECTDEAPLDLSEVEWCEGYEGTDLCCVDGDPCDLGDDQICQCGDTCSWEAGDCSKVNFVFNVFDAWTGLPVEGATCTLVDSTTGTPLSPTVSAVSDKSGNCDFVIDEEESEASVRVSKAGYRYLYMFHLPVPGTMSMLLASYDLIADIAESLDVTLNSQKGIVLGIVFWIGTNEAGPVGCAVATNDAGATQTFYLDEGGEFTTERTSTYPGWDSAFITFNVTPGGPYEFTLTADEAVTEGTIPKVFESAITLSIIVYGSEFETNPTPFGCE